MKIKPLVENFIAPERKNNSAGIDIFLQNDITLQVGKDNIIGLGFASEFPENQRRSRGQPIRIRVRR